MGVMPMPPAIKTTGTVASVSMKKWPAGALDGNPVARLSRPVRQRVAAREGPPRALRGPLAVGKLQLKGQELPRFERRQGAAVDGFEIEGTLRLRAVFEHAAHHTKLAPAGPGARWSPCRGRLCQGVRFAGTAPSPPQPHAKTDDDLEQQRQTDVGE